MRRSASIVLCALLTGCSESGGVDAAIDATVQDAAIDDKAAPVVGDEPPRVFGPWPGMLPDVIRTDDVFSLAPMDVIETPRCVPGTTARCVCDDLREGLQGCYPEGAYRVCVCPPPVPPRTQPLPPRLIRPLSGLRVTSQRPTLRWALPDGVTRARVEVCADRPCARVLERADVSGTSWRPSARLTPGVVFWRVQGLGVGGAVAWTSATWEFGVRHSDAPVDTAYGSLKDYNGDGYDDMVVVRGTIPEQNSRERGRGLPFVYYGSRVGVAAVPNGSLGEELCGHNSFTVNERFRLKLASGDVNGDGLADLVLAGWWGDDPCGNGETVLVHLGSRAGLSNRPLRIDRASAIGLFPFPGFADSFGLGDVNGDGYSDLLVFVDSSPYRLTYTALYLGSAVGLAPQPSAYAAWARDPAGYFQESQELAYDVTTGDVDGDGYGDAIVRAHESVMVLHGDAGGTLQRRSRAAADAFRVPNNGQTVDMDLDDRADLIGGSPTTWWANAGDGLVQVYRRFEPYTANQRNARILSGEIGQPGDGDGDGLVEVVVRDFCPDDSTVGCRGGNISLYVRRSTNEGIGVPQNVRAATPRTRASFVGDLNGDGADDLVMADGSDLEVHALVGGMVRRTQTLVGDAVIRIE